MQTRDFCYWLQGFFEISESTSLTAKEVLIIKNHLNLVFKHDIDKQYAEKDKPQLQAIHSGSRYKTSAEPQLPNGVEIMC